MFAPVLLRSLARYSGWWLGPSFTEEGLAFRRATGEQ